MELELNLENELNCLDKKWSKHFVNETWLLDVNNFYYIVSLLTDLLVSKDKENPTFTLGVIL